MHKGARPDLCGGRGVTRVPTATYVGRLLGSHYPSSHLLTLGLIVAGLGNALTGWGAQRGAWSIVMVGMVVLGSGGGLLNGETQKAIMSVVPRERAGMASGISTTARFSGILLGFAMLSGVLATVVRNVLAASLCNEAQLCHVSPGFADAVVAGDLSQAVAGLTGVQRDIAIEHARIAYSGGFSAALMTAALMAGISAAVVYLLMRERQAGR